MSLTQKLVRDAKPEAKTTIHWDSQCSGLGLRVTVAGVKSFVLSYRFAGRKRLMTLGRVSELSLNQARETHSAKMQMVRSGIDPIAAAKAKADQPTIGDLLDQFTAEHLDNPKTSLRPKTIGEYRAAIERHIRPKLGRIRTDVITRSDIRRLHREMGKDAPYLANRVLATASRIFSLAVEDELLDRNPAIGIERFPEQHRERYATSDELIRLTTALAEADNQDVANVIRLMMVTGCRKNEAMSARWEQFDSEPGYWVKPDHATKQKRQHRTPLNEHARELIRSLRERRPSERFLFPAPTKSGHIDISSKQWAAIRDAAGLKNFRMHDLRHSFASILVSSGFSLEQIGRLLGHTNALTTQRYAHVSDQAQQQATDHVAAALPSNVVPIRQ